METKCNKTSNKSDPILYNARGQDKMLLLMGTMDLGSWIHSISSLKINNGGVIVL